MAIPKPKPGTPLTPRELEILRLIFLGHCNKVIATKVGLSPLTVKNHVQKILCRMGLFGTGGRMHAVYRGLEEGLLTPPPLRVVRTTVPADQPVKEVLAPALPEDIHEVTPEIVHAKDWLRYGRLMVSESYRTLRIDDKDVKINNLEFSLLCVFFTRPGLVHTRQSLLNKCWGKDVFVDDRTVDVHIRRLRALFEGHGITGVIQTVPTFGYRAPLDIHPSCKLPEEGTQ